MRMEGGTEHNRLETLTVLRAGARDSLQSAWPLAGIPGSVCTTRTHHALPQQSLSGRRNSYVEAVSVRSELVSKACVTGKLCE